MSSLPLTIGSGDVLAEIITAKPQVLVMTDYDGTLVSIRERPELAIPGSEVVAAVDRLRELETIAFAVISGRSLEDLEKIIPVSGIHLIGCHGAQFRNPNGERFERVNPDRLQPVIDRLAELASGCIGGKEGFLIEHKGIALALHYREAAISGQAAAGAVPEILGSFIKTACPLMAGSGLETIAGKKVLEIRPCYINKGMAVKYLMDLYPEHYPVYFGDDTTDEDAFAAVAERGTGVLVSRRTLAASGRFSAASLRLPQPEDVIRLLEKLAAGS
ncbi:trehalose-phosphatase [Phosphitispora fastidiosa]|uniref:trehalose-phosphatase n=1 Tax=Phosphitispora fastidiosa TaxID=2837202 RepID=UPI001E4C2260|nr:trehalose-phosphatase [Phosphitispora fastidiosa]MBU7008345.1 trehalose 6-phosphate phosphatase [Phosphitispora fastidiosa]